MAPPQVDTAPESAESARLHNRRAAVLPADGVKGATCRGDAQREVDGATCQRDSDRQSAPISASKQSYHEASAIPQKLGNERLRRRLTRQET